LLKIFVVLSFLSYQKFSRKKQPHFSTASLYQLIVINYAIISFNRQSKL